MFKSINVFHLSTPLFADEMKCQPEMKACKHTFRKLDSLVHNNMNKILKQKCSKNQVLY